MKKLLLLSLNLFVCMLAMGEPVSSKQALEIASGYLLKSGAPRRAAAQMSVQPFMTDRQGNPLMYAVNNGGDGYYNLAGQRVSADYKGIVIHNGKKVVKK